MNNQKTDPEPLLQQLFSEQRAADERRAPPFARVWPARVTLEKHATAPWFWPAAVTAAVALAVGIWFSTRPGPVHHQAQTSSPAPVAIVASLSEWTAPSDWLLAPEEEWD